MSTSRTQYLRREQASRRASNREPKRALRAAIEAGVYLLLAATPLALGSVSVTAIALMEAACFTLFFVALGAGLWRDEFRLPRWVLWPTGLFVVWTLLQILPLPPPVLAVLSPGTNAAYSRFLPGYGSAEQPTDLERWLKQRKDPSDQALGSREGQRTGLEGVIQVKAGWRPISWYPWRTVLWLSRFLAYAAFAFLVAACLSERALEKRLPWLILALGSGIALLGILQYFTWNGKILWVIPVYQGHPFGPFVNSNHFSGYLEMALPLGCGVLLREAGLGSGGRRRRRSLRSTAPRLVLGVFLLLPMLLALLLARSRGGLFALALTACLYFGIQVFHNWDGRRGAGFRRFLVAAAPLLLCVAGIVAYISWIGDESPAASRVEPSFSMRVNAWRGVVDMIAANPVTGTGLGTFALAYPFKKTYGETEIWEQAHNDYLQLFSDSGIVGFTIFLVGLWFLFRRKGYPLLAGSWRRQPAVLLGACLGMVVPLIHSLVEFNLQIPSNGLLFVLLGSLLLGLDSADSARPGKLPGREGETPNQIPGSP